MHDIVTQLNALADLQARHAQLQADHTAARLAALPARVRQRLCELDAYYAADLDTLEREIAAATTLVKAAVLEHGHSIRGERLHAVVLAGRTSWDTRALEGYSLAHPEVLKCRTVGPPSVSLRKVST
jgi:hypothetical protein